MKRTSRTAKPVLWAGALAAAAALAACQPAEEPLADQRMEPTAARADTGADEPRRDAAALPAEPMVADATRVAVDVNDKVADAAITASVNADLAKDTELSALQIDVDTTNGHVVLRGTAPSEAARERAARMASNVHGVTSVNNQLTVNR